MDNMKRFSDKYEKDGAGAKEQEMKRQEERRLLEEIERKNREEELKRHTKEELQKRQIRETSEENLRIMREKEREKNQKIEENRQLRDKFQREYEESKEEEKRKNERKRIHAMELKAGLDQQIQERHSNTGSAIRNTLSQREMELNRSLLKKIEDDREFQEEVYRRLHPTELSGKSRENSRGNPGTTAASGGSVSRQRRSGGNIF